MGPPALHTPRLRLRALSMADAPAIFAYSQDPEVASHVLWETHASIEDSRAFLSVVESRYDGGLAMDWGIELEGRVVGTIGFFDRRDDHRRAELGYALGRAFWGRGLMVEACAAVVDHGFDTLGFHRVVASTRAENVASQRVLEKAGFRREGLRREHLHVKGRWWDIVVFGRLAHEREVGCAGS